MPEVFSDPNFHMRPAGTITPAVCRKASIEAFEVWMIVTGNLFMTLIGSSPPLIAMLDDGVKLLSPIPLIINSMRTRRWLNRLLVGDILWSCDIFKEITVCTKLGKLEADLWNSGHKICSWSALRNLTDGSTTERRGTTNFKHLKRDEVPQRWNTRRTVELHGIWGHPLYGNNWKCPLSTTHGIRSYCTEFLIPNVEFNLIYSQHRSWRLSNAEILIMYFCLLYFFELLEPILWQYSWVFETSAVLVFTVNS